jgi:hypothetical protein
LTNGCHTIVTQSELETIIKPETLNDIALAARTQGHMDGLKIFLERQRPTAVIAELKDVYQVQPYVSQAVSLPQGPEAGPEADIKVDVQAEIRKLHGWNRQAYQTRDEDAQRIAAD